ncbi:MAG: protein translocase subunit SecF, partial [Mariprofundus sp.]
TVIGYSLNDTIVVFDRIRENFAANRKRKTPQDEVDVVNGSINQTLGRTLMTSVTTLLVVLALFFLGGEVIHDFAFALIAGILVGTYSSIFVASPVMMALEGRFKADEDEIKAMEARP